MARHQLQQVHHVLSPGWFLRNTEKNKILKMVTVCILFFLCYQKIYQCWTSTCRNITCEIIFSQLLGLYFALMFVLPMMQLFLPTVSCCYNKPFPIHVISKGEKTAWKQNKENRTKENQGFFQRPIWCTSINRKKMPEEVGAGTVLPDSC